MTHDTAGLVTRALTKTYMRGNTPVHALAGVDLTLPQGTQVAIMGPSGSGKTTLLHCLAGVLRPSSGSITLDGEEMTTMSERVLSDLRLRRFGFVFQDGQLLPELPTEENIAMPLMLAGTPKSQAISRAREILANLGLDGAGPYRPGQLSGGQAQRVAIGRALATNPSVIFADEPTGALDQATGGEVMSLLTSACASTGASLVLVTHDPAVAARLPHTIHVRDGRISLEARGSGASSPAPASSGDVGTRVLPDCQGPMMLSCSFPNGRAVRVPCDMVIEKWSGVARRGMRNNEAWGTRPRGYPIGRSSSRIGIRLH